MAAMERPHDTRTAQGRLIMNTTTHSSAGGTDGGRTRAPVELLTLDHVAAELVVSRETARQLCVTGRLPFVDVGTGRDRTMYRVLRTTLDAFVKNERRVGAAVQMEQIRQTCDALRAVEERW